MSIPFAPYRSSALSLKATVAAIVFSLFCSSFAWTCSKMRLLDRFWLGLGLRDDFLPSEIDFSLISVSLLFIRYKALILLGLASLAGLPSLTLLSVLSIV